MQDIQNGERAEGSKTSFSGQYCPPDCADGSMVICRQDTMTHESEIIALQILYSGEQKDAEDFVYNDRMLCQCFSHAVKNVDECFVKIYANIYAIYI